MKRRGLKRLSSTPRHAYFARQIREELRKRNWSAGDLATKVGVTLSCVSRWVHGQRLPYSGTLAKIKAIFGRTDDMIWG